MHQSELWSWYCVNKNLIDTINSLLDDQRIKEISVLQADQDFYDRNKFRILIEKEGPNIANNNDVLTTSDLIIHLNKSQTLRDFQVYETTLEEIVFNTISKRGQAENEMQDLDNSLKFHQPSEARNLQPQTNHERSSTMLGISSTPTKSLQIQISTEKHDGRLIRVSGR